MNVSNREEMIEILNQAVEAGALKSVIDIDLRDIRIETVDGSKFKIVWFTNLCTLKAPGFYLWFDSLIMSTSHPCFKVAVSLAYRREAICRLGEVHDYLKEDYDA